MPIYPSRPAGVPVAPNGAYIRGTVKAIRPEGDGWGATWDVAVHAADEVAGMANFARSHVGRTIALFVHPGLTGRADVGGTIRAKVAFRGDERGGRFVVLDNDLTAAS